MRLLKRKDKKEVEKSVGKDAVVVKEGKDEKEKKNNVVGTKLVILRPLVTEKAAYLASQGKYVFEISKTSGQVEVKEEITRIYGVRPAKVNIQNYRGDRVRFGRRMGKKKSWKKAIVTLAKGDKIDVHEGV